MSRIQVDSIVSKTGTAVSFTTGISGSADSQVYKRRPEIITFSPEPASVGIATTSNIVVTFNQNIQFSGSGTINLRSGSETGTIIESYTCGVSARATINNSVLTIDPTSDLAQGTTYFVTFPSVGIANTFGAYFIGTSTTYKFTTVQSTFAISGGTTTFTRSDVGSPTGFYKYHVFTATSPLVLTGPSTSLSSSTLMLVGGGGGGGSYPSPGYAGGGGGGGGVLVINNFVLNSGTYTVTIGAGGVGASPTNSQGARGQDTTISPPTSPTTTLFDAYGGGAGYYGPRGGIKDGGSGGGFLAAYGPNFASYAGLGLINQGNPGGSPSGPTPGNYYSVGTGGGGGATQGLDVSTFVVPTVSFAPGTGYRGGNGGSGRSVTGFTSSILTGNVPTIPTPSINKIGPTGLYGGGGGGGAGPYSSIPVNVVTAGAGGPGGGGHGAYINPLYSSFTRNTATDYTAENGYANTGGGGGGTTGPYTNYNGGTGGSGIAIIRYATPSL